jgi:RNA polymerase sigma factor (sigma-70 family)
VIPLEVRGVMLEQVSDSILLERFVSRREEAAFVALVTRHGPLVRQICSRILGNEHDIEDVFQATFFVLARKAAVIPWRQSVGAWVGSVAQRLALSARSDASRLKRREISITAFSEKMTCDGILGGAGDLPDQYHRWADPAIEIERRDLNRVLDDELRQLPEKYRAPVVLCDLEGHTHEEAAQQLGWPAGSMSRRLERARTLLRRRLVHRGVSLAIGVLGFTFAVLAVRNVTPRPGANSLAVRAAMSPFRPASTDGTAIRNVLNRIAQTECSPDLGQIMALARRAAEVAEEIVDLDPGTGGDHWRKYTDEMRLSAVQLADATRENNRPGILSAGRRLDASCQNCHAVYH